MLGEYQVDGLRCRRGLPVELFRANCRENPKNSYLLFALLTEYFLKHMVSLKEREASTPKLTTQHNLTETKEQMQLKRHPSRENPARGPWRD